MLPTDTSRQTFNAISREELAQTVNRKLFPLYRENNVHIRVTETEYLPKHKTARSFVSSYISWKFMRNVYNVRQFVAMIIRNDITE
jgi:hypothetical protein